MSPVQEMRMALVLIVLSLSCSATDGRIEGSSAGDAPSGDAADVAIRLGGDLDHVSFPVDPSGSNRVLTATIRGGRPRSVWLAPNQASGNRAHLTKVDDGEYQINLYARAAYDALREGQDGSFRVFAELPSGETVGSVAIRYTIPAADVDVDFSWDKATVTLYQRSCKAIPGSNGRIVLDIGDITAGQVLVSAYGPGDQTVIDMTSMRVGSAVPMIVGDQTYMVVLDRLVNLFAGRDFAEFSFMSTEFWKKERIDRLLASIKASDATFIRNEQELDGRTFASHLRLKLGATERRHLPIDVFIEEIASRSWNTGQPYRVRQPDGETVDAAIWLRQQVAALSGDTAPTTRAAEDGRKPDE